MGPWEPHGNAWYNCNRFDEEEATKAREGVSSSRNFLERYLHYYNRYANHERSRNLEGNLWKLVKTKQVEMQAQNYSWIEVQVKGLIITPS